MANRSPSTFDTSYDESVYYPGKPILAATPDTVHDNQQFIIEQAQCLASDTFYPLSTTSTSVVTLARFAVNLDLVGQGFAGSTLSYVYAVAYCWASDGSTQFTTGLYFPGTTDYASIAVTSSTTTKTWRAVPSTAKTMLANGTEELVELRCQRTAGSGTCYVAGYGLFTSLT